MCPKNVIVYFSISHIQLKNTSILIIIKIISCKNILFQLLKCEEFPAFLFNNLNLVLSTWTKHKLCQSIKK